MDMQSIQEKLTKIQNDEEAKTTAFIRAQFGKHSKILDISNKYLVKEAFDYFLASLSNHFKSYNTYKSLILENCLMNNAVLGKLLTALNKLKIKHEISTLDIANNQVELTEKLAKKVAKFFEKSLKSKEIQLNLQGNVVTNAAAVNLILNINRDFKELSLYDTRLSPEVLLMLSEYIAKNKTIYRLDLSYNPTAFTSSEIVHTFGISIGINSTIESLNLSGNTPLHKDLIFIKFLSGIANNKSLLELSLGNLNLRDRSMEILSKILFPEMPLMSLDIQSNQITWKGFDVLLSNLPYFITSLDVSYNDFRSNSVLESLGRHFKTNRTLRKLNLSYSIELQTLNFDALDSFCSGITENISLSELWCEGIKIGEDPDEFCSRVGDAISNRKYSLTFKISAVNCFTASQNMSSVSRRSTKHGFKFA